MESYDVPDSTDWLGTPLAALMQVEQAFRCHVCKDFYNSPMITTCCHTFCSLCIRRSLGVDGKCPLCRATDQENKLRGNWSLREAVEAFVQARASVIEVARARAAPPPAPASPKRKADDDIEDEEAEYKRPRMSTRRSKAKAAEATAAMMRAETDISERDDRESIDYEPDDGLVACPICWTRMKPMQVDKHIDTSCLGAPQQTPTSSTTKNGANPGAMSLFTQTTAPSAKPPERLPPLNYSMLNDQALRKKLSGLGISSSGSRQLMEKRHKEWVTLWNANCDSARPKKRSELLQDLGVWERTVGAPAPSRASALGTQIKDKEFDGEAWAARHDTSFRDLIANARRSRLKATQASSEEDDSASADSRAGITRGGGSGDARQRSPGKSSGRLDIVDLTRTSSGQAPHEPGLSDQANVVSEAAVQGAS